MGWCQIAAAFVTTIVVLTGAWASRAADGALQDALFSNSKAFLLCDTKTSADSACASFNVASKDARWPVRWQVSIEKATGCSGAYSVAVRGMNGASGVVHTAETLDATTSAVTKGGPPPLLIDAALSTMTGCTDLDVLLVLFYEQEGR